MAAAISTGSRRGGPQLVGAGTALCGASERSCLLIGSCGIEARGAVLRPMSARRAAPRKAPEPRARSPAETQARPRRSRRPGPGAWLQTIQRHTWHSMRTTPSRGGARGETADTVRTRRKQRQATRHPTARAALHTRAGLPQARQAPPAGAGSPARRGSVLTGTRALLTCGEGGGARVPARARGHKDARRSCRGRRSWRAGTDCH